MGGLPVGLEILIPSSQFYCPLGWVGNWKPLELYCMAPVRKFTKSPYTSLKFDYLRDFNKLLCVDDKGLALPPNSIKRQSVSGRVSKYTWINK